MKKILQILTLGLCLTLGSTVTYAYHDTKDKTVETYQYMNLLQNIFDRIREDHVDPVNDVELLEAAIRGMIGELDPHSSYLNPKEFSEMRMSLNNSVTGIGAQVTVDKETGFIKIISPIDDSPAQAAGLKTDDLIISVNGETLEGLSLNDAVAKIRGPKGSTAKIGIKRGEKEFVVDIVRNIVKAQVVRYKILDNNIGYIRLSTFSNNAADEMIGAFIDLNEKLGDKKYTGLILDLRNNPGGLLDVAIKISNMFVKEGEIISTRGRDEKNHHSSYNATAQTIISLDIPMVVLINKGSASSSEIVAGTLQDLGRAIIVGQKSYGKGSVQTVMELSNGGALRLTTEKYYTASGKIIHGVGISPDVDVPLPDDYEMKLDEIDPQLKKAMEVILLNSRNTDIPSPNCADGNVC